MKAFLTNITISYSFSGRPRDDGSTYKKYDINNSSSLMRIWHYFVSNGRTLKFTDIIISLPLIPLVCASILGGNIE